MLRHAFIDAVWYWNDSSKLTRISLVLLSGILTVLASPHENAVSILAWVCMTGWLYSLINATMLERCIYGFLYGTLYIVPGQCSSIWHAIQMKQWSTPFSLLSVSLFFFVILSPLFCLAFSVPN